MEGDDGIIHQGEGLKPRAGIHGHNGSGDGGREALQHVGDNAGVADGDAHGTRQGQEAQNPAGPGQLFLAGAPGQGVAAHGAGLGPAADGVLGGEGHIAEQDDEQQVGHQERAAAVAAQLGREAPDVGHAHRAANRRQDEAPAGSEFIAALLFFHSLLAVKVLITHMPAPFIVAKHI